MDKVLTVTINPAVDLGVTVDRVAPVHKLRCRALVRHAGGGGVNVARVIHRMSGNVNAAYVIGGPTGALLRELLSQEGVPSRILETTGETRENMTVHEKFSGEQYRFVLPGPEISEPEWRAFLNLVREEARGARFLVASGSLPPGAPDDFYARCARIAKDVGAAFILDCAGAPLVCAVQEDVDMIKPSLRELEALIGRQLPDETAWTEASRELLSAGKVKMIALSLGEKGALLFAADLLERAHGPPIAPKTTVGAGDSFLGGMVWSLASGQSIDTAFRYGMAAAVASLIQPGTQLCSSDDVHRFAPEVTVEVRAMVQKRHSTAI